MQTAKSRKERTLKKLEALAFGKANDCVRLVLEPEVEVQKLDLSLLAEIKRSDKGGVELKLLDRTKILAQLAQLCDDEERSQTARQLLRALEQDEDEDADDGA